MDRITRLLDATEQGDGHAAAELLPHVFVCLRIPEAAEILEISPTTAKRHWTFQ